MNNTKRRNFTPTPFADEAPVWNEEGSESGSDAGGGCQRRRRSRGRARFEDKEDRRRAESAQGEAQDVQGQREAASYQEGHGVLAEEEVGGAVDAPNELLPCFVPLRCAAMRRAALLKKFNFLNLSFFPSSLLFSFAAPPHSTQRNAALSGDATAPLRVRMYETQRDQLAGQQFNIEQAGFSIESAKVCVLVLQVLCVLLFCCFVCLNSVCCLLFGLRFSLAYRNIIVVPSGSGQLFSFQGRSRCFRVISSRPGSHSCGYQNTTISPTKKLKNHHPPLPPPFFVLQDTVTTVAAMKSANAQLKQQYKQFNIDQIEDMTDDLADMMEDMNEINEAMGRSYATPDDVDEADLEAELDLLEDELEEEDAQTEAAPAYLQPSELPAEPAGEVLDSGGGGGGGTAEEEKDEYGLPIAPQVG